MGGSATCSSTPAAAGQGLGAFIVRSAMDRPEVRDARLLLLGTKDAHDLDKRSGFTSVPEPGRWMQRCPSEAAPLRCHP
ncbi:MAG TPA: hypothetical protein VMV06_06900 [Acidimicrobiales bacterium]|nr:hypothetical protein [Acidimicrobiales bacterium]